MASHESAKKSIRKSARQHAVNTSRMNRIRTFIKKLEQAIAEKVSKENILKAFSEMQKEIMKGVNKKVVHKNAAARKISRMSHKVKVAVGEDKK
ncbi:MAG: 30S ribosomal protein S20 [Alphaproteobacteria bacterium]|nr:30S ribosomal protein S20 [Alphaproteobacteria bacterium]